MVKMTSITMTLAIMGVMVISVMVIMMPRFMALTGAAVRITTTGAKK